MPTYELECRACGNRFERFLTRLLRDEDRVCPECGSTEVRSGVGGGFGIVTRQSRESNRCTPRGGFG
jgi:putative FmdB family regulatory protein